MSRTLYMVAVAVALYLSACGGDQAPSADAACVGSTGCNGECAPGNDYGVGKYCTLGGGECAGLPAIFCTVDFSETTEQFCTRPCDPAADVVEQCGVDAVCRGESEGGGGPYGCVLAMCQ